MKIILLNGQEALLVNDRKPVVTVVNGEGGTLIVNEERFRIEQGQTPNPVVAQAAVSVRARFEDEKGIRWKVLHPRLSADGVPYSSVDYTDEYVKLRTYLDRIDRKNEELHAEMLDLRAMVEPDSLGFLNIEGEEK